MKLQYNVNKSAYESLYSKKYGHHSGGVKFCVKKCGRFEMGAMNGKCCELCNGNSVTPSHRKV